MHITDIRRHNLIEWFKDRAIPEKEKSYISQLKSGRNSFGEKAARRLEETYGMGELYLDRPLQNSGVLISGSSLNNSPINNSVGNIYNHYINENISTQTEPDNEYYLKCLDVLAEEGIIEHSSSYSKGLIRYVSLSDEGMGRLVGRKMADGLYLVYNHTDNMNPTIPKGVPAILDTNINSYIGEGVYAFIVDNTLFIRRLQKLVSGGYLSISDNKPQYKDEEMPNEIINNAKFIGKFIKVWKIEAVDL